MCPASVPFCVLYGGAYHRQPRRLVASVGASLDAGLLVLSVAGLILGSLWAYRPRLGRLLGLGSRRKRGHLAVVYRDGVSALADDSRATRHDEGLERRAGGAPFLLTMVGHVCLTRSGIVQSVHAFGNDPELAARFLAFIGFASVFFVRLPDLSAAASALACRSGVGAVS